MAKTEDRVSLRQLSAVITTAFVLFALFVGREIILPMSLAVLLSFLLTPLVRRLERLHIPRIPAVLTAVLVSMTILGAVGWLVSDQLTVLSQKLPEYKGNLIEKVRTIRGATRGTFEKATSTIEEIGEELAEEGTDQAYLLERPSDLAVRPADLSIAADVATGFAGFPQSLRPAIAKTHRSEDHAVAVKVVALPPSPLEQVKSWLGPLVAPLTTFGVVLILTIFILLQREDLRNRVIQLFGTDHLRITTEALDDATSRISRLLRMQLVVNSIYGISVGLGLYFIGLPNATLWGILGVLLRFLPYLGPWLVAAFPVALSLAIFDTWAPVGMTVGLFIVLELLVNNVLEPWLYGASTGVSSVGIIFAAIFWTWLWGPIGLVLAMPITVCVVVAGKYVPQLNFLTVLLGSRSTLTVEERFYQRLLALDDEECDRLVAEFLRTESRESLYDRVLIPALQLAERDRHAGLLSDRQEELIVDTVQETIEEQTELRSQIVSGADEKSPFEAVFGVLCVPARDEADEMTCKMLVQLLESQGIAVYSRSNATLASELIEQIRGGGVQVVVISALPPGATRHARYLCKRIQAHFPEIPIVIGLWNGGAGERSQRRFVEIGATHVVTSLAEAVEAVKLLPRQERHDSDTVNNQNYSRETVPSVVK